MEIPRLEFKWEQQLPAYTTAQGRARFLTYWARQGIEPASSGILIGFLTHWAMTRIPRYKIFNKLVFLVHSSSIYK